MDTQSVREYPVEAYPTLGNPDPFSANVYSTDLETGQRLRWNDTLLTEPSGQYSHIFWAPFRAEYGHIYNVEVIRSSDGARTFADVRVPNPVTARIGDQSSARAVELIIEDPNIRALNAEVEYVLGNIFSTCDILRNTFSYKGQERLVENGWLVEVNLVENRFDLLFDCGGITTIPRPYCPPGYVPIHPIDLHLLIGDAAWNPPGGVLSPHIISQPGVMTNVENGFGFVGAGYRTVIRFYPADETLQKACFAYE